MQHQLIAAGFRRALIQLHVKQRKLKIDELALEYFAWFQEIDVHGNLELVHRLLMRTCFNTSTFNQYNINLISFIVDFLILLFNRGVNMF